MSPSAGRMSISAPVFLDPAQALFEFSLRRDFQMLKLLAAAAHAPVRRNKRTLLLSPLMLALASAGVAATGISVNTTFTSTSPGGFIFDGSRMWVADGS